MPISSSPSSQYLSKSLIFWIYLALFLFLLNVCVPMVWDDWSYRENSWGDILPGAYREYFVHNPRIASTLLTRCFSLLPPLLVDTLNTLAFLLLGVLSLYLAFGRSWRNWAANWQSAALFWVLTVGLVPVFGEVFLWHCGSASYLWVHLCALGMLALLRPLWDEEAGQANDGIDAPSGGGKVRLRLRWMPLLALMALIAGCSNFHTGPAILLSCAALSWMGRTRLRFPRRMGLLLALSAVSCVLILIAPGNDGRMATLRAGEDYKETTRLEMLGRLLEPHLRALPLYALLFFAIRWRNRRRCWGREDRRVFYGFLAIAALTQLAFLASPATPPARSWQITFALIIVASMRALLPIMILHRPRRTTRALLLALALLPLLGLPKMIAEREWLHQAARTLSYARSSGQDVELPYWPFTKDKLFGFMREYVSSENPQDWKNTHLARCYGINSVRQSSLRCTYAGVLNGWKAEAASHDAPRYATLTHWNLTPGKEAQRGRAAYLCLSHPEERKRYWRPSAVLHRLFADRHSTALTQQELKARGYRIETLQLPAIGEEKSLSLDWTREKKYSKKPASPTLWAAVLPTPPEEDTLFTRLLPDEAGKWAGRSRAEPRRSAPEEDESDRKAPGRKSAASQTCK